MRHLSLIILFLVLFQSAAAAGAVIDGIDIDEHKDSVRVTLDVTGDVKFSWSRIGRYIQIDMRDTVFSGRFAMPRLGRRYLDRISAKSNGGTATFGIYLVHPLWADVYSLGDPGRIVIDLKKDVKEFDRREVAPGMEYVRVARSLSGSPVVASVLMVDPEKFEVRPGIASGRRHDPNALESFMLFMKPIFPWVSESVTHFFRERVTRIASREGATAAVNGTYFGRRGEPLGTLMIDGELITTPIYDRAALVISDDGKPTIDTVFVNAYFLMPNGVKVGINGMNQPRILQNDVVLYTSAYGRKTETDGCVEAVVKKGLIWDLRGANSSIPDDGYVLSVGRNLKKLFDKYMRRGEQIELKVELVPYSTSGPSNVRHIISGGPRLVKSGRPYVSKREEKFRWDIARTRTARTAVGVSESGKMIFVTADSTSRIGRKPGLTPSAGMRLEELADFMIFLGAVDAVNLDGGGSSTMVVEGEVVNTPANGCEISVSNAVLIKPKAN